MPQNLATKRWQRPAPGRFLPLALGIGIVLIVVVNLALNPWLLVRFTERGYLDHDRAVAAFTRFTERVGSNRVISMHIAKGHLSMDLYANDTKYAISTFDDNPEEEDWYEASVGVELDADELRQILTVLDADAAACGDAQDVSYFISSKGFGHGSANASCLGVLHNLDDPQLAPWQPLEFNSAADIAAGLAQISAHDAPELAHRGALGNYGGRHSLSLDFEVPNGQMTIYASTDDTGVGAAKAGASSFPPFRVADLDPERIWSCAQQIVAESGSTNGWFIDIFGDQAGNPILVWDVSGSWTPLGGGNATDQDCQPVTR